MDSPRRLIAHVASGSTIFTADVLEVRGELWLIARWFETPDGKWRTPDVAIRIDRLPHQKSGAQGADLTISHPIAAAVLDGTATEADGVRYEVIRGPSEHFGNIPVNKPS